MTVLANLGAAKAYHLVDIGFELVCVSAIKQQFHSARLQNLSSCGFSIQQLIATENEVTAVSSKAAVLQKIIPVALVDDYPPNAKDLASGIHTALIH